MRKEAEQSLWVSCFSLYELYWKQILPMLSSGDSTHADGEVARHVAVALIEAIKAYRWTNLFRGDSDEVTRSLDDVQRYCEGFLEAAADDEDPS